MCCGSPSLRKWLTLRGAVRLLAFVLGLIVLVGSADGGIENVVIEWPTAGAWVPREFDVTGTASGNPYQPGVVDRLYVDGQATLIKDGRFKKAVRAKGDGPLAVKVECARVYDNGNRVPYWAQSVNVNVDGTKPEIRVTTPNDRSRDVSPGTTVVAGEVREANLRDLRINGEVVEVNSGGRFEASFKVGTGEKLELVLLAVDRAGNEARKTITLSAGKAGGAQAGHGPGASPETSPSADASLAGALEAAKLTLVRDLKVLAGDSDKERLYRFRDRLFGIVLQLEPNDASARAGLKYRRDPKSGGWQRAPDYREPTDWAVDSLPKVEERLRELLAQHRDASIAILSAVPDLNVSIKDKELDALIVLMPDDGQVHALRGDVEHGGRWVMLETVSALEQRALFREAIAVGEDRAKTAISPSTELPPFFEGDGFEDGYHRVFGWTGEKWTRESLRFMVLGASLTAVVMQSKDAIMAGPKETLLFPSEATAKAWMQKNPKRATPMDLRDASAVGALTIEDGTKVVYFGWEPYRRTSTLSSTVQQGILWACPDDKEDRAWIRYGLGTRIISFVTDLRPPQSISLEGTEGQREANSEPSLPDNLNHWLKAAAGVLADRPTERLARVLTIRTNAMRPSDLLVAYALAAYLREGKPTEFQRFLDASHASNDAASVVREGLGWDLQTLASRLRRWLPEQEVPSSAR